MTKSEKLTDLFDRWKSEFYPNEVFYKDGITNEEYFDKANKKILFITKEPNAINHEKNEDRSFVTEWNTTMPTYPFSHRIAEWSYGILNEFPIYSDAAKNAMKNDVLKKIALMNLKKSGGTGTSAEQDFTDLIKDQKHIEYIHKQIEIIDPEIIIFGLATWHHLVKKSFPEIVWSDSNSYHIQTGTFRKARVINFYHPSARNVPAASYSLLQNVYLPEYSLNI